MVNKFTSHSPLLVAQIESLMLAIANETDINQLTKRRINSVTNRGKWTQKQFIDLSSLADFRETLMRTQTVLSPIYIQNAAENVAKIERTMPPQYHQTITFSQAAM